MAYASIIHNPLIGPTIPVLILLLLPLAWFVAQPGWLQSVIGVALAAVILLAINAARQKRAAYLASVAAFGWRDDITPTEFERRCAVYLGMQGWKARTTAASGDQGVDVLAEKAGVRVVIQCKRYSKPVGNKAVQEALAGKAFARADAAAVVSNASYTPSARTLAVRAGVHLLHYTDLARADVLFGIASAPGRVVRACSGCGRGLRLPLGRRGIVKCPICGSRAAIAT